MSDSFVNASQWKSWVSSANTPECGFPLQNLPFCAFDEPARLGAGIGDCILDLAACVDAGLLDSLPVTICEACAAGTLNALMELGRVAAREVRQALMLLLREDADPQLIRKATAFLVPAENAAFRMPVQVGNYSDFYASIHHATNVGKLFRPDNPLLPNYKFVPIGYHGRASSIVISETPVTRPHGQTMAPGAAAPVFTKSKQLDYEVEMGAYLCGGNALGKPIPIHEAESNIFGISLLNDWSARDIQAWEYQPLGPFLGKSFATTVSPWVVTSDALQPFRAPLEARPAGDPEPLPYLQSPNADTQAINLQIDAHITTAPMRDKGVPAMRLSSANLRDLYWSFAQMVTHHSSNGCNLMPGDLIASGTISGSMDSARGCLLEITQRGIAPVTLPTGETRSFLEDGDEITLTGMCRREGFPAISLGSCRGRILPARP
ncbi:MAG TPA: fumarylacetoacetase [Acidobacteriaceae bacterium]|jgi:fumarylacetoacetase